MPRIRTVKPDLWTDSKTGTLSDRGKVTLIGMLNFADDYGIIEYDIPALKAKICPYSLEEPSIAIEEPLTKELLPRGLIVLFTWGGSSKRYLWIRNFDKHQVIDRPGKPIIEGFSLEKLRRQIDGVKDQAMQSFDELSSNEQRMVVDSSALEGKGVERKGKEGKVATFLDVLKDNPAYENINLDKELGKMQAWIATHPARRLTKQFAVRWLNRATENNQEIFEGHVSSKSKARKYIDGRSLTMPGNEEISKPAST